MTMIQSSIFRGCDCNDATLRDLMPIVEEWLNILDEAALALPAIDDPVPWGDNEVPSTALLYAAAWRAGFVARQEFNVRKESNHGRSDLWVLAQGGAAFFEAKFVSPDLVGKDFRLELHQYLERAVRDAEKVDAGDGRRIGMAHYAVSLLPRDPAWPDRYGPRTRNSVRCRESRTAD